MTIEEQVKAAVRRAAGDAAGDMRIVLNTPDNPEQGDYATSIAMQLAKQLQQNPSDLAKIIAGKLAEDADMKEVIDRVEVAGPGFINIFLVDEWFANAALLAASDAEAHLAAAEVEKPKKVQVEFISANPTGPLTLHNGRGGFLGDAIARVLDAAGHKVTREYYVNDAGEQVKKLGASVMALWGVDAGYEAEEHYKGEYVEDIAKELGHLKPKEGELNEEETKNLLEAVAREASKLMLKSIKRTVQKEARIPMDNWFSEKSLTKGATTETIKELKRKNLVEEREGALWLKLTTLGDEHDKDRVVVKSNGEPAYVLPDIAYHYDKFVKRNFERVIDIFGADHQGHAKVLAAALPALGLPKPEFILMQLVKLIEDGKEVRMSKRTGRFIVLEELLEMVGSDVARWFFIERTPNTHMTFDLTLAKDTSEKNPVFYVQYAHARCASILKKALEDEHMNEGGVSVQCALKHPTERELAKKISQLPELVSRIAESLEVHQLTTYATELAQAFSAFYRDCPVLSDDEEQTASRLALVIATKNTIAQTLGLMGIRAPESM